MRCSSFCTAESYNSSGLVQHLIDQSHHPKYFDEIIHVQKKNDDSVRDIFYFDFGAVVIWGASESEESLILEELKSFETGGLSEKFSELIYSRYDKDIKMAYIDEDKNEVVLSDNSIFAKLSISYAFAQSVKLSVLESSVSSLLENTKPIQQELAIKGSVSLSKKQLSQKIGKLFSERYLVNLHSDVLDTPEFFWKKPQYESLYLKSVDFQDIQLRQGILNHRLDMIHELYTLLTNELNYVHSTRLETVIVILIAIEVSIAVLDKGFVGKIMNLLGQIF